jgi:ABC-type multidrug transport system fused ATPase/permease subunit
LTNQIRNVTFRYSGSDSYALRNVSFKIEKGQLCVRYLVFLLLSLLKTWQVIVGANGSGKSTILKLVARLYEPSEGQILINDRDISILKLDDLRLAISVLFQDYTHFPLTVGPTRSFFFDLTKSI